MAAHDRQIVVRLMVVAGFYSFSAGAGFLGLAVAEQHVMAPRVPDDKLAEARALTSPLPASTEIQAKGKVLYEGKGTCMNCHGQSGAGDGPLAASLNPTPRNFHHHGFWRHRTEGEVFWVIKYGVPGTAMIGFGDQLTDEEIWTIIQYERSFSDGHGHHRGMRRPDSVSGCCEGQEPKP